MIRLQKWAGMLTYVSKYFLPPGTAQEQVNIVAFYLDNLQFVEECKRSLVKQILQLH